MIYLDHAASTPVLPEALKLLSDSYAQDFANPSAAHRLGRDLGKKLASARENLKALLGSSSQDQLIFCSSATEANNLIVKGLNLRDGAVLCSEADHPSLIGPVHALGADIVSLPLDSGRITVEKIEPLLTEKVRLVLLSHVNNHSGNIQDIKKISSLIKEKSPRVHIHVDGSQSFTKFPIDLKKWPIDSLALSSHKMGGPRGIAALWLKKGVNLKPFFVGGGQEMNLRPSTEALPLILSFLEASHLALKVSEENLKKVVELSSLLTQQLKERLPGLQFPFETVERSPYITTIIIPGISSDILLRLLEEKDIFVSSSSACSSKIKGHSSVFEALGIPNQFHKNVLRLSIASMTSREEIETFVSSFTAILDELKFLKK